LLFVQVNTILNIYLFNNLDEMRREAEEKKRNEKQETLGIS